MSQATKVNHHHHQEDQEPGEQPHRHLHHVHLASHRTAASPVKQGVIVDDKLEKLEYELITWKYLQDALFTLQLEASSTRF